MNWDQIETKWAAMTRRVQGDWQEPKPDEKPQAAEGKAMDENGTATDDSNREAASNLEALASSPS